MSTHHQILVIGGGNAGISVAAQLLNKNRSLDIAIVEPFGDASSMPTSRTGAAIRKQAPILVKNLFSLMQGKPLAAKYSGYTSCPVVTGYGKLVLAEFDYDNQPTETFPFNQAKERWSMFMLKRYILPWLYWNRILTGKM